jgi:hypothetical protein
MRENRRNTLLPTIGLALTLLLGASQAGAQSGVAAGQEENPSYLFQVALLVGSQDGSSSLADLPQNARKAIEDIQGFLSFKSYRLIDVAILRSNGMGRSTVNGPEGQDYEVRFHFFTDSATRKLIMRSFKLSRQIQSPPTRLSGLDTGEAPPAPADRDLISTSFSVDANETIVVGSSKLDGNGKALIVLLTAIP